VLTQRFSSGQEYERIDRDSVVQFSSRTAKVLSRRRTSLLENDHMDPLFLLEAEHEVIRGLLGILIEGTKRKHSHQPMLTRRLASSLTLSNSIEEELLSKIIREGKLSETEKISWLACLARHRVIMSKLLPELLAAEPSSATAEAILIVLRENAARLFQEEEAKVFPRILGIMSPGEMSAITMLVDLRRLAAS
jgi:hypothetical protein